MTRAREKLIITATLKNAETTMSKLSQLPTGKVAPQIVSSLRSVAEWVLIGVRGAVDTDVTVNLIPAEVMTAIDSESKASLPSDAAEFPPADTMTVSAESLTSEVAHPDFDFVYSFGNAPDLPSKLTVTGVTAHADPEAERASWTKEDSSEGVPGNQICLTPGFITEKATFSAAQRGTLLHLVMQHIDYNSGSSDHDLSYELQRLALRGVVSEEQIKEIDIKKIKTFLDSALGRRIRSSDYVKKEFKFSILRPAELYFPDSVEDEILLQGVVDCFFEEDNELVVVDFKTDKVSEDNIDEKAERYSPQLRAYADALEIITGKCVKERIIYFFSTDTEYSV